MGSKSEDQQGACPESPAESQEVLGLYLYLGTDDDTKYLVTEEDLNDKEAVRLQTQLEIRTLYQNGVPCFSRSAIQNLVHQIDDTNLRVNNGEPAEFLKFQIPTINGGTAEIEVETGTIHQNFGGHEVVM
ncbi:hypothetical protein VM1G_04348 [Cytospora mali]|uniref:Uncharacterized protein n=1 Tax=Cytospora mali TaxID=578113 RepID=A0A194VX47_CYTMA|nr:hypothetical protein VM1G_04348 [Valsa mali]